MAQVEPYPTWGLRRSLIPLLRAAPSFTLAPPAWSIATHRCADLNGQLLVAKLVPIAISADARK